MISTVRRTLDADGQVWVNAQDLVDWLDESLLRNVTPEGSTIKLELSRLLGQMTDPDS